MEFIRNLGIFLSSNLALASLAGFIAMAGFELVVCRTVPAETAAAQRALVNFGTQAISLMVAALVPVSAVSAALLAQKSAFGLFQHVKAPSPFVLIFTLLAMTGLSYGLHRLSHRLPLLWRLHRCHHSDPHIDVSLALRHHPLEQLPAMTLHAGTTLILGLPVWAVAVVQAALILANYWEHLPLHLSAQTEQRVGRILVTPAIHRIHHSADRAQTDSNFGSLLTIWDRLFGSFTDPAQSPVARTGLGDAEDAVADRLVAQLLQPFVPARAVPDRK